MSYSPEIAPPAETDAPTGCGLLHRFIEHSAHRWPGRVAVDIPAGNHRPGRSLLTYAALESDSNALAALLRPLIHGECVVGILLPRTSDRLFVAQLAVLKAGAAYTCLDPSFPDERFADILDDAAATLVLTDAAGLPRIRQSGPDSLTVIEKRVPANVEILVKKTEAAIRAQATIFQGGGGGGDGDGGDGDGGGDKEG